MGLINYSVFVCRDNAIYSPIEKINFQGKYDFAYMTVLYGALEKKEKGRFCGILLGIFVGGSLHAA